MREMDNQSDSDSQWSDAQSSYNDGSKEKHKSSKKKSKKKHHRHRKLKKKKDHKGSKLSDDEHKGTVDQESDHKKPHSDEINQSNSSCLDDDRTSQQHKSDNEKNTKHYSVDHSSRRNSQRSPTQRHSNRSDRDRDRHRSHRRRSRSPEDRSSRRSRSHHSESSRTYRSKRSRTRSRTRSRSPRKRNDRVPNNSKDDIEKSTCKSLDEDKGSTSIVSDRKKIEIKLSSNTGPSKQHKVQATPVANKTSLIGEWTTVAQQKPLPAKSSCELAKLTQFCKDISKAESKGDAGNVTEGTNIAPVSPAPIHHPFRIDPAPFIPPPMAMMPMANTLSNQRSFADIRNAIASDVTKSFPVSSGIQHRQSQDGQQPSANEKVFEQNKKNVDISSVLARRLSAQQKLLSNAGDIVAATEVKLCDLEVQQWSQSHLQPGQFSGASTAVPMQKAYLEEGYKTWARKDMFHSLPPIQGGVGMRLLQKMGWTLGQPLGKRREGFLTPIAIDVKTDRKGLTTSMDVKPSGKSKPIVDFAGKHPVSALSEMCSRQHLGQPSYELIMDQGPPHNKKFLFKVIIKGQAYQAHFPSGTKKQAKADGALAALKARGLR